MKKTISISRSIKMVPFLFVILFAGATLASLERCPPEGDISPCVCHGNPYITHVVCSNITSLEHLKQILKVHPFRERLPQLVLQNLPFSTLPPLGLDNLRVRDLEILDGNISHFSKNAIQAQPLITLRVDRNRLADVPSEALDEVRWRLTVLSMSGNVLKKLGYGSLSFMHAVENLTLSENEISEVARVSFPANLKYLWISRNKLTTFNSSLHLTKKLKHLDASNNRLKSMKGEFDGLLRLQTVILDHNYISDISGTFSHLHSVRKLSLVGNRIWEIGEALDLQHLRHLNLSRNAITNLNPTIFENMIDLYDLNFSENPLTAFQFCPTIRHLMFLRILNLSNSNLETLLSDCFRYNTNLELVDLSRNQLSTLGLSYATKLVILDISFNKFQFVDHLNLSTHGSATLILEDNPWKCSEKTTSGLKDLDERGFYFPSGYPTCFQKGEKPGRCILYNAEV